MSYLAFPTEPFEALIGVQRKKAGVTEDADLSAEDWRYLTQRFKVIVHTYAGIDFPSDPYEQLKLATEAVSVVEWPPRHCLPQSGWHRPQPRNGRQHPDNGLRQPR